MTKIDKILYGGFAVVAIGVVVAMLVTIFSPSKQTVEETAEMPSPPQTEQPTVETASTLDELIPPDGYVGYYLDDDGNKVWFTQEQLDAGSEYEQELKRQEEEQKALDEAEKKWWESRQEWVERFPFEPTFHQEIKYDPNVYDAKGSAHWPEEKKDKAFWDMMRRVQNHGFLRHFYASYLPYTKEFEQMCNIIEEEFGEVDDPIPLGWTFNALKDYHLAVQRDPDEIYMENARVENEPSLPPEPVIISAEDLGEEFQDLPVEDQNMLVRELTKDYMKEHMKDYQAFGMPSYEVRDITWGEETENLKECILGPLVNPKEIGDLGMEESVALAIQERLINEIPAEGFLRMGKEVFAYNSKYESELKPGDPLLIK